MSKSPTEVLKKTKKIDTDDNKKSKRNSLTDWISKHKESDSSKT